MLISRLECDSTCSHHEIHADIDGFDLWYKLDGVPNMGDAGGAMLCAALIPAMRAGSDLHIKAAITTELLAGIVQIQEAFACWYGFQKINVTHSGERVGGHGSAGVGSFFSGGVDGLYSFLKHREQITHLLFTKGIDMQVDNDRLFDEVIAVNQRFADHFGVKLVVIQTNIRRWLTSVGSNWVENNGGGLASMAHLAGLGQTYIAATHCYDELFPWGSHPLTDRLWSTESSQLIHDGIIRRSAKLRFIGETPSALRNLRVCWQDNGYNCQKCAKCLRTRIGLRLLGLTCDTLQPLTSIAELKRLRIDDDSDYTFFLDNFRLAKEVGDMEIAAVLERSLREWRRRRALVAIDRDLTGGMLKRLFKSVRR